MPGYPMTSVRNHTGLTLTRSPDLTSLTLLTLSYLIYLILPPRESRMIPTNSVRHLARLFSILRVVNLSSDSCILYQVIQPILGLTPACHMARGEFATAWTHDTPRPPYGKKNSQKTKGFDVSFRTVRQETFTPQKYW